MASCGLQGSPSLGLRLVSLLCCLRGHQPQLDLAQFRSSSTRLTRLLTFSWTPRIVK